MNSIIKKIKWHPWRGSYRFVLFQEITDNIYADDIYKNSKILQHILMTTKLEDCKTEHLNILYDILDNMGEKYVFYLSIIVNLAMTINNDKPDKIICWEIIGEMLKKKSDRIKKKYSVLRPFLSKYKEIIDKNINEPNALDIVMDLFYEVHKICPVQLESLSTEAQAKVMMTEKGKILINITEPISQPIRK